MNGLRSFVFLLISLSILVVVGILCLPLLVLAPRWVGRVPRWFASLEITLLRVVVGLDLEVRGLESLPESPVLIASKHQSALETYMLAAMLPNACFVLKREIVQLPIVGWYVRAMGVVAVDRSGGSTALKSMVRRAGDAVSQGRHVVIFPEGTRTGPGERVRYHPGVAALYGALDVPVAPVAVNTGLFWARKRFAKKSGRAVIAFLDPIAPGMERKAFMEELAQRIESASDQLLESAERP